LVDAEVGVAALAVGAPAAADGYPPIFVTST
jgi:hypothetical protein